jgi:hypothetical protein
MNLVTAHEIVHAVEDNLRAIQCENGYYTDAGDEVYLAREQIGEQDVVPALSVYVDGEDADGVRISCGRRRVTLRLSVVGFCRPDPDNGVQQPLNLMTDVKRALFGVPQGQSPLGRLVQELRYTGSELVYREEGGLFSLVVVMFSAVFEEAGDG